MTAWAGLIVLLAIVLLIVWLARADPGAGAEAAVVEMLAAPASGSRSVDPAELPPEWGWCRLNDTRGGRFVGYNYVDEVAGASFHVLVDLADDPTAATIRERAAARPMFRGELTIRLNGHEWVDGSFASAIGESFLTEVPSRDRVISLVPEQVQEYGLPLVPDWIPPYL